MPWPTLANSDIRAAVSTSPTDHAALANVDAVLQHAMQLDPTNVFALFNACLLRRVQRRVRESIELCKRALDIDPRHPGALRELGHDLLLSGDAEQAITSYRASIDAAPYLPYAYNAFKGLGVASLALGHREDAIMYLRKATELDIHGAENEQLWLAAVLEMGGRHAEALKLVEQFIGRHPGQQIDNGYLELLHAPAYADRREEVLAALASAGYSK
jgi:tetratricopeptide (TPR) repeat protein